MPSNKDKVASYLETDEIQALDKFCQEKECSRSQGVIYLIRNHLIENDETLETECYERTFEKQINFLREANETATCFRQHYAKKTESIEEHLTDLEYKIDQIEKRLDESTIHNLSDEQIASVTGRRMREVYEWRMGIRKPRGKNILKALEPYEIVDGLWKKKRV